MELLTAYCSNCSEVVALSLLQLHQADVHPGTWLTLTWNEPLPMSSPDQPNVSRQLDQVADRLE